MSTTENIFEAFSGDKIDRVNGVIRNVKLIGFESKNGRTYPAAVLKTAVNKYEGAKVNIDHPEKDPTQPRSYNERFGIIRNARFVEGSGVHGDFHFNPKHPIAEQFCWDAEHTPESLGFSHNATLRMGPVVDGKEMVEAVVGIRSMDLVADPATTRSLFECEQTSEKSDMDYKAKYEAVVKELAELKAKMKGDDAAEEVEQLTAKVEQYQATIEQYEAKEKLAQTVESIDKALEAAGLDKKNPNHVSELFSKQLLATESEADRQSLIEDRAALLNPRQSQEPSYKAPTNAVEQFDDSKSVASYLLS